MSVKQNTQPVKLSNHTYTHRQPPHRWVVFFAFHSLHLLGGHWKFEQAHTHTLSVVCFTFSSSCFCSFCTSLSRANLSPSSPLLPFSSLATRNWPPFRSMWWHFLRLFCFCPIISSHAKSLNVVQWGANFFWLVLFLLQKFFVYDFSNVKNYYHCLLKWSDDLSFYSLKTPKFCAVVWNQSMQCINLYYFTFIIYHYWIILLKT